MCQLAPSNREGLIGPLGLDPARAAVSDLRKRIVGFAAIVFAADDLGGVKRQARGRQGMGGVLVAHPFFTKCATGFPQGFYFLLFAILPKL